MVSRQLVHVLREIRKRAAPAAAPSDHELLDRYLAGRDETAFAALVERHGGLVLNVCRRMLPSAADADDACQAVFLVLARKAAGIRKKGSVGSWLHGTAYRLAANLRRGLARRRRRERPLVDAPAANDPDPGGRDVRGVLDEELRRLPEKLRLPLLLCYLEGKSRDEAARCLGWSLPTLRGRLERGRDVLRVRLARRGLDLSAAVLAALLTENVLSAAVPPERAAVLARAALSYATGGAAPPVA
jgi:RNA polymerase sigma factor (sigma-70 family)